jgi:hypothetical protein
LIFIKYDYRTKKQIGDVVVKMKKSADKRIAWKKRVYRNLYISVNIFFIFQIFCSHKNPYYHSDIDKNQRTQITQNDIRQRIILIGDAGEPTEAEPVLQSLGEMAREIPSKTAIFFLGDNIYPAGLPDREDPAYEDAEKRLRIQINAVKGSGARIIFIPGNHDWAKGGDEGLDRLNRQQNYVTKTLGDTDSFLPKNGCPGPEYIDFEAVRVIILDTDFFVNSDMPWNPDCHSADREATLEQLSEVIKTTDGREVLVLAHHPLDTHGPHGGFYDWQDHIFPLTRLEKWMWLPLPIIGSLYPLGRWNLVKSDEDLKGNAYKEMVKNLTSILKENPPLVYAAGHEHSLQVLANSEAADYILVSGAGCEARLSQVGHGENTLFAHQHTGFMMIDFFNNGEALLRVIEPPNNETVFSQYLVKNGE